VKKAISMAIVGVLAVAGAPSSFAKYEPRTPADFSSKDLEPLKLAKGAKTVIVPGYRVWFTVQDAASASAGGGKGAKASLSVLLRGVEPATMQEIADAAFADFMEQLKATGKTVVGPEEAQKDEAWADVKPITNPDYDGAKEGKGIGFMVYSPASVPLWVHHMDQFGGANPFNQKSTKAMYKLSKAHDDGVVVVPNIYIRFAKVSSSGRSNYSRHAEVGVEPWMAVQMTSYVMQFRKGGGGISRCTTGIRLEDPGEIVKTDEDRGGLVDLNPTGMGDYWKSVKAAYKYQADPAKYKSESIRGIQSFNKAVAEALQKAMK
jgi:hypothetical protein